MAFGYNTKKGQSNDTDEFTKSHTRKQDSGRSAKRPQTKCRRPRLRAGPLSPSPPLKIVEWGVKEELNRTFRICY